MYFARRVAEQLRGRGGGIDDLHNILVIIVIILCTLQDGSRSSFVDAAAAASDAEAATVLKCAAQGWLPNYLADVVHIHKHTQTHTNTTTHAHAHTHTHTRTHAHLVLGSGGGGIRWPILTLIPRHQPKALSHH